MKRVLIVYRQRLGDIVGCLPAALHLSRLGHEVEFCCFPQYHAIFRCVSYCRPVGPEKLKRRGDYAQIYHLEITRREYDAYRASGINWRDYVYGKYEAIQPAAADLPWFDRMIEASEYALPARYALAAPMGVSQVTRVNGEWFQSQCRTLSQDPWYILTDRPLAPRAAWGVPLRARSLEHLPALIAGASTFVTINSAPNIIAAGVRKTWYQVDEPGFGGQDNYHAPGQIVLHQPAHLARYSWRFQVNYWRRKLLGRSTESELKK
jgi:hypothetical protein